MTNLTEQQAPMAPNAVFMSDKPKKPYQRPRLEKFGDILTVTLNGSPGMGDSGNPGSEKP